MKKIFKTAMEEVKSFMELFPQVFDNNKWDYFTVIQHRTIGEHMAEIAEYIAEDDDEVAYQIENFILQNIEKWSEELFSGKKLKKELKKFISIYYGKAEAENPAYDLNMLTDYLKEHFVIKNRG